MGSVVVVVDEVLEQFIGEVVEVVEGRAVDDVVIEGTPEAFDLAVGLRPIGPGVAVFDAELELAWPRTDARPAWCGRRTRRRCRKGFPGRRAHR